MRRFHVWLGSARYGHCTPTSRELVEMPDDASDEECEEACREALDNLIANECDSGWDELAPDEELPA